MLQFYKMLYQKGQKESVYYSPHSFNPGTDLLYLSITAVMLCAVIYITASLLEQNLQLHYPS